MRHFISIIPQIQGREVSVSVVARVFFTILFQRINFFIPAGVIDDLPEEKVSMTAEIYYDNKPCYYEYVGETKKFTEADFQ